MKELYVATGILTLITFTVAFVAIQFHAYEWVGLPQKGQISEIMSSAYPIHTRVVLVIGITWFIATPASWILSLMALTSEVFRKYVENL